MFPEHPGSHLMMKNPALEFVKSVCQVIALHKWTLRAVVLYWNVYMIRIKAGCHKRVILVLLSLFGGGFGVLVAIGVVWFVSTIGKQLYRRMFLMRILLNLGDC